jgi:hypothetical protein
VLQLRRAQLPRHRTAERFSDSITEARDSDGVEFGENGLCRFIARTNGCNSL